MASRRVLRADRGRCLVLKLLLGLMLAPLVVQETLMASGA